MQPSEPSREPLPIWFFVGVILLVYGVLVIAGGTLGPVRPTVLAETKPALWWGAILCVFGAVFTAVGWLGRDR
jgi:drug/metabolite transporter (DMT)-like permease